MLQEAELLMPRTVKRAKRCKAYRPRPVNPTAHLVAIQGEGAGVSVDAFSICETYRQGRDQHLAPHHRWRPLGLRRLTLANSRGHALDALASSTP